MGGDGNGIGDADVDDDGGKGDDDDDEDDDEGEVGVDRGSDDGSGGDSVGRIDRLLALTAMGMGGLRHNRCTANSRLIGRRAVNRVSPVSSERNLAKTSNTATTASAAFSSPITT